MSDRIDWIGNCHSTDDLKNFCENIVDDFQMYVRNIDVLKNVNKLPEEKIAEIIHWQFALNFFGTKEACGNEELRKVLIKYVEDVKKSYKNGGDVSE